MHKNEKTKNAKIAFLRARGIKTVSPAKSLTLDFR